MLETQIIHWRQLRHVIIAPASCQSPTGQESRASSRSGVYILELAPASLAGEDSVGGTLRGEVAEAEATGGGERIGRL